MLVGASCVEVKTEADSIAVTECSQDDNSTIGMFPISDDIFSVFVHKGDKLSFSLSLFFAQCCGTNWHLNCELIPVIGLRQALKKLPFLSYTVH